MKTISALKTRNGGYGFYDIANEHEFIIFDSNHAVDETGEVWQIVEAADIDEGLPLITFESEDGVIFNYAEDGGIISYLEKHFIDLDGVDDADLNNINYNKVRENFDDEDLFEKMKETSPVEVFNEMIKNDKVYEIRSCAEVILKENYESCEDEESMSFREYVEACAESEPSFFRWLFDAVGDEELSDFECPNEEAWEDFLEHC